MSLAAAMMRGTTWQALATVSTTVGQVAVAAVLARLLTPADFGIVAMGFAVTELIGVIAEFGAAAAVAREPPPTRSLVRAALRRTAMLGLIGAAVAVGVGGGAERWLDLQTLMPIAVSLAIGGTVASLGLVLQAIAESKLEFRRIAIVDVAAYWTGALVLSIPLAFLGLGPWALVIGFIGQALVRVIAHAPLLGTLDAGSWGPREVRALREFGRHVTSGRVLNVGVNQVDKFALGAAGDATAVGLYSRPMVLVIQLSTAVGTIYDRILYPVFGRLAATGNGLLVDNFLRAAMFVGIALAPLALFIAAKASPIVAVVFGAQWTAAVPVLRWGAVALPALAIIRVCDTLLRAADRPARTTRQKLLYVALLVPAVLVGLRWGATGVAVAFCAVACVMMGAQLADAMRAVGGSLTGLRAAASHAAPLLALLCGAVVVAAAAGAATFGGHAFADLALSGALALGMCLGAVYIDSRAGAASARWIVEPFLPRLPTSVRRLLGEGR